MSEFQFLTDQKRLKPVEAQSERGKIRDRLSAYTAIPIVDHWIDSAERPFLPHGWSIEEHRSVGRLRWDAEAARLSIPALQTRQPIAGTALRELLAGADVLNATVLDYLYDFPHLVPADWEGLYVFFWGTVYRRHSGLAVRGLYYADGVLNTGSRLLTRRWARYAPAAIWRAPANIGG